MKRAVASALVLLAVALSAGEAAAQEAPAAPAPPAPLPGVVRINVRAFRHKGEARVYAHRPDDSWVMVCAAPCTFDVAVGNELRITMGSYEDEPYSFIVPGDLGPEVDVEVKPASVGPLVGGIVMMGTGGAFVLCGLLLLAVADIGSRTNTAGDVKTVGYVITGIGAASAAGGLLWLLTRSHEPRVTDTPHRPRPNVYGRADTLLGDVASATPRDATSAVPAPFAPVRFGFTF